MIKFIDCLKLCKPIKYDYTREKKLMFFRETKKNVDPNYFSWGHFKENSSSIIMIANGNVLFLVDIINIHLEPFMLDCISPQIFRSLFRVECVCHNQHHIRQCFILKLMSESKYLFDYFES